MEREDLGNLFLIYSREIYCYIYSLCHNHAAAEDLVQETFIKALISLNDSHTNVRSWLYLVARNLCLNYLSQSKKQTSLEELPEQSVDDVTLSRLISNEERQLLYQAIQHLKPRQREVLTLQYFSGLSQKEISKLLNLSNENVRILAYRAKKELRRYMEVHGYEV